MWPAFWMVASDHVWGPEFDVAEYFGNQQRMHFGLMYSEIGIRDSSGVVEQAPITRTEYTKVTLTFTTPASTETMTLFCRVENGSGDAYCDDFDLNMSSSGR